MLDLGPITHLTFDCYGTGLALTATATLTLEVPDLRSLVRRFGLDSSDPALDNKEPE